MPMRRRVLLRVRGVEELRMRGVESAEAVRRGRKTAYRGRGCVEGGPWAGRELPCARSGQLAGLRAPYGAPSSTNRSTRRLSAE
jgi:hypothetical protein